MMSSFVSSLPAIRGTRSRLFRGLSITALLTVLTGSLLAQPPADPNAGGGGGRGRRQGQNGGNADAGGGRGGRGNFDPAQAQEQMMTRMREQLGVTDDAEWKLIMDRITAVTELRRGGGGGMAGLGAIAGFGGRGGGQGGGGGRGGRGGFGASPEQAALQQAIADNLPDAEIKSRLSRLREVRKDAEEKLTKAQEELRAVLSVKQEALAVMAGLLP